MENKGTAASGPSGLCEKLFNALHLSPPFRPFRRIGYHPQEPVAAAAAMPAPSPPIPNSVGRASTPPTKSSGLEHPGGDVGILHRSGVSVERAPEVTTSRMEPERVRVPLKAPSKVEPQVVNTIPSKNLTTYTEPRAPPPSQLQTERASNTHGKALPPPPTPAPAPEKEVPNLEDVKTGVDKEKPAVAEIGRTRTKIFNQKVDEYINRTKIRMRTRSNVGSSSSKG